MTASALLDAADIARRIPHAGRMCLLHALVDWSPDHVLCSATGHGAADHPLRTAGGLLAPCAIEYAAQAMALHGALMADDAAAAVAPDAAAAAATPRPGYLASVRGVRLAVATLHDRPGPLVVRAQRLAGDGQQILYQFSLHDGAGALLADGRATVVLNTPLPCAPTAPATPDEAVAPARQNP